MDASSSRPAIVIDNGTGYMCETCWVLTLLIKYLMKCDDAESQPVGVNVVSHPIQRYAVWFGGSVLGSTPVFYGACHTKAEYEEYGASICRTNPVFKGMY
ncbi:unnamed protein product [Amaranthus hypochondriacus]